MPRVHAPLRFETKTQHNFAWSVFLEKGGHEINLLERKDTILPPRNIDPVFSHDGLRVEGFKEGMIVYVLSISRADAVLTFDIGTCLTTFSGPWFAKPDRESYRLPVNLEVPARQQLRILLRLLPVAPSGLVTVHVGVVFYEGKPGG